MAEKEKIVPVPSHERTAPISAESRTNVLIRAKNSLTQAENRLKKIRESLWVSTERYDGIIKIDDKNGSKLDNAYAEMERRLRANSNELNAKAVVAELTKLVTDAFEAERKMIDEERKKKWLAGGISESDARELNNHEQFLASQLNNLSGGAQPLVHSNGAPAAALKNYGSDGDGLDLSRLADGDSHFSKTSGKALEFGMQSGLVMAAPAASKALRKNVLPFAPAVMMAGMATRGVTTVASKEMSKTDKAIDMGKMAGEVVLYATPIVGTGMTAHDAYKAFKEGKTSEWVALSIGTAVSAVFDGVTLVAIATGIGAPGAVGLTAVRVGIKEAVVAGTKQGAGFFARNASKIMAGGKALLTEWSAFVASNSKVVVEAIKMGPAKFVKETALDTGRNLKDLMTLKSARDWVKHRKENPTKAMQARQELEKATVRAKVESGEDPNAAHIDTFKRLETEISSRSLSDLHTKLEEVSYDSRNEKSVREGLASLSAKDQYVLNGLNAQRGIGEAVDKMEAFFKQNPKQARVQDLRAHYSRISDQIRVSLDSKLPISPNLQDRLVRMKASIDKTISDLPKNPTELVKNPFVIDPKTGPNEGQKALMDFSNGLKGTDTTAARFSVKDDEVLAMTGQNAPRPGYEADTSRTTESMLSLLRNDKLDPGNRVIIFRSYLDRLSARGHSALESVHKDVLMNASIPLWSRRDFFLEYVRAAREGELGLQSEKALESLAALTKDNWSGAKAQATLDFVADLRLSDQELFTKYTKTLPDQAFAAFTTLLEKAAAPHYSKGKMGDSGLKMSRIRVIEEAYANTGRQLDPMSQSNLNQRTGQLLRGSYQQTVIENRSKLAVIREMVLSGDPKANAVLLQTAVNQSAVVDKTLYTADGRGMPILKIPTEKEILSFIAAYPDPAIVLKLLRSAPEWKSAQASGFDHVNVILSGALGIGSKFSVPERMKILQELESIDTIPDSVKWFSRLSLGEQLRTMSDYEFALHQADIKRYIDRFKPSAKGAPSELGLISDVRSDYDARMKSLQDAPNSVPARIRKEMITTAQRHVSAFVDEMCQFKLDSRGNPKYQMSDAEFYGKLEHELFPQLRRDGHANADLLVGIRYQMEKHGATSPVTFRLKELEQRVKAYIDTKQVFHFDMDEYVKLGETGLEAGKVQRARMLAEYIAKNNITSTKDIARTIANFAEIQSSREKIQRWSNHDGKVPDSEITGTRKAFLDIAIGNSKLATERAMRDGKPMPLDEVAQFFAGKSMDFRMSLLEELEAEKCFSFREPQDRVLAVEMLESSSSTDFRNNVHRLTEYLKKHNLDAPAMNTRFLFHEFATAKDSATAEAYMEMLRSQKTFVHPRYLLEAMNSSSMHAPVQIVQGADEVRNMLRELVLSPDGGAFKTPLSMQKRILLASHEYLQNDPQTLEFLRKSLKSEERSAALYTLSKRGDMAALERTKWYGDVELSGNGGVRFSKVKDPQLVAYGLSLKNRRDLPGNAGALTKEELEFLTAFERLPREKSDKSSKRVSKSGGTDAFTNESLDKLHSLFVYAHLGESARGSLLYEKLRGIATMVSGAISQSSSAQAVEEGQKVASGRKIWDTSRMAQAGTHGQETRESLSAERIAGMGRLSSHQQLADRWRVIHAANAAHGEVDEEEEVLKQVRILNVATDQSADAVKDSDNMKDALKGGRIVYEKGREFLQSEPPKSHLASYKNLTDRASVIRGGAGEWRTEDEERSARTNGKMAYTDRGDIIATNRNLAEKESSTWLKEFIRTRKKFIFFTTMAIQLGISTPAAAANVGRHIDEAAKKSTEAKLAQNTEYQKATAERRKQIYQETIREMTRIEMEKVLQPMQIKVEKKLESALAVSIGRSLSAEDKRVPDIKRLFLPTLRQYVNEKEEASAFYGLYEATNGDNAGTSMETVINGVLGADHAMTEWDIGDIFRRIGTQVTPNLNPTEIDRLRNYFFGEVMRIR